MEFLPIISGMLGGAAAAGFFKGPIQTVEDWWYVTFGHTANEHAEMLRVKQQANIEAYKHDILQEISQIPPENVKEPPLNILGPSLEASKYYIDDATIRKMFAKLIASSINSDFDTNIHPSYVELIKQMTSLDANVLVALKSNGGSDITAGTSVNFSTGGTDTLFKDLYLGISSNHDQKQLSLSLSNLSRLGILNITYTRWRLDETVYDVFKNTDEYRATEAYVSNSEGNISGLELDKGIIELTALGINFCKTCL